MSRPWTELYRPKSREDFVGNKAAVKAVEKWLDSWSRGKPPKRRAMFLYGPPGVGKTSLVHVLAREKGFHVLEVNASDTRNKDRLEELVGKAIAQNYTLFGQRRLVLLDEMDGLSGSGDRGGVSFIAQAIDRSTSPMLLVANTVEEDMGDRFRAILRRATPVEFKPLSFSEVRGRLEKAASDQGLRVDPEVLDAIALNSEGDLRSALVDLETVARGRTSLPQGVEAVLESRDRRALTPEVLNRLFSSRSLQEGRKAIRSSSLNYDDLFDWIHENLPIAVEDPQELAQAYEALSRADLYRSRARTCDYRLLKYMFDLLAGGLSLARVRSQGVGYRGQLETLFLSQGLPPSRFQVEETPQGVLVSPRGWLGKEVWARVNTAIKAMGGSWVYGRNVWLLPYYRRPQLKWRYIRTYHARRRAESVARILAKKCHTSTSKARAEILPFLIQAIRWSESFYREAADWLRAPVDWKSQHLRYAPTGKGPGDFASLENYGRYKQRAVEKRLREAEKQVADDLNNLEKWLDQQRQAANWKKS